MIKSILAEQEEVWKDFMKLKRPNRGLNQRLGQRPGQWVSAGDSRDMTSERSQSDEREASGAIPTQISSQRAREVESWRQVRQPRTKFQKYRQGIAKVQENAEGVERKYRPCWT